MSGDMVLRFRDSQEFRQRLSRQLPIERFHVGGHTHEPA